MPHEIERKFLLSSLPPGADLQNSTLLRQGYLSPQEGDSEVRIRDNSGEYTLTYKKGSGLVRREIEVSITREAFDALWPATEGLRITKTRYLLPWSDFMLEIDVYHELLEMLIVCEIEYPSQDSANKAELPPWIGAEITDDLRYSNRNLATYGQPRIDR